MSHMIQVATIQMDGTPAPTAERLKRAEVLLQDAVKQGANLIVLPATFNTGKTFLETNYEVTERLSDRTMQWMCGQAQQHQIHLVGSWMIVDKDDTYHSAFLIAPDGKSWRYDAQYPYLWERVFYRDGQDITVADTAIGKIGMMIARDVVHSEIYERYATKVDLLLILNDNPDFSQAKLQFDDGSQIQEQQFGFFAKWLMQSSSNILSDAIENWANWLNVPLICAGASGEFASILPAPFFSVHGLLFGQSGFWQKADHHYAEAQLVAPFQQNTCIVDANGHRIAEVLEQGDAVIVAEVTLEDKTPLPLDEPQPEMGVSERARFIIDLISSALFTLNYRRGVRRQWGARMASMDASTAIWLRVLIVVAIISAIVSQLFFRKKP